MLSLPRTSCLHLYLSHPCWEPVLGGHLFPLHLVLGKGEAMSLFCDIPPTSLHMVALLLHSQSPSLASLGGDSRPRASPKAQVPVTQLSSPCGFVNYATVGQMPVALHRGSISLPEAPRGNIATGAKLHKYIIPLLLI